MNQLKSYTELRDVSVQAHEKHTTDGKYVAEQNARNDISIKEKIRQLRAEGKNYSPYKERLAKENG